MKNTYINTLEINSIYDIYKSDILESFVSEEINNKKINIYIVIESISFNVLSKLVWKLNDALYEGKVINIIFNQYYSTKEFINNFMNNENESFESKHGNYKRNASNLLSHIKSRKINFYVSRKNISLNVIVGENAYFGLRNLSYAPSDNVVYYFREDYEDAVFEIEEECGSIISNALPFNHFENILYLISKDYTAEQIYYLTLLNLFQVTEYADEINKVKTSKLSNSSLWNKLFEFQKDGVYGLIHKLDNYGGAILADSVGLGKTFQALSVIKYYSEQNKKSLVLCPRKLEENWKEYLSSFKNNAFEDMNFDFTVQYHTTLISKMTPDNYEIEKYNYKQFDLLIIDEAHVFRNNKSKTYSQLFQLIRAVNPKMKVLLLSATPINNSITDLVSLIDIITCKHPLNIDGEDVPYKNILKQNEKIISEDNEPTEEFRYLISKIIVSRDKSYISKIYEDTNLYFPHKNIKAANIELNDEQASAVHELYSDMQNLTFAAYNIIHYVRDDYKYLYVENSNIVERSKGIASLMHILLLKRYESTFKSFKNTIENIINKMEMLSNLEGTLYKESHSYNLNNNGLIDDFIIDSGDELEVFENLYVDLPKFDVSHTNSQFQHDLTNDIKILKSIINNSTYSDISKLKFAELERIVNNVRANGEKILIFTSYKDTANELAEKLSSNYDLGLITGEGGFNYINGKMDNAYYISSILNRFSPSSRGCTELKPEEIDILIATDVISEGQNLQDCSNMVNYDIHWNPVKVIQRQGRIDRIGSVHKSINNYLFWPTKEIDTYLNLVDKFELKTTLMKHVGTESLGEDSKFNSTKDSLMAVSEGIDLEIDNNLNYSTKQLLKKFEIDYNKMKVKINEDNLHSIFVKNSDYMHNIIGITIYLYHNTINSSSYYLYKVVNGNKKSPFYPYVLAEVNSIGEITLNNVNILENLRKLQKVNSKNNYVIYDNYIKKDNYRSYSKDLNLTTQKIVQDFENVKEKDISLICAIHQTQENKY